MRFANTITLVWTVAAAVVIGSDKEVDNENSAAADLFIPGDGELLPTDEKIASEVSDHDLAVFADIRLINSFGDLMNQLQDGDDADFSNLKYEISAEAETQEIKQDTDSDADTEEHVE